jgi:predicted small lipoprotein YifL
MRQFVSWFTVLAGAMAAAACGEVKGNNLPDAPVAEPDAPPPVVKVSVLTIVGDGAPDLTAKVVFQDPTGAVVADGLVDAEGRAQAMLPNGGSVTTIRVTTDTPTALAALVTTVRGVQPADDLTFGLRPPGTIPNQGGQTTMTANFTLLPQAQTPGTYQFFTACGSVVLPAAPAPAAATLTFRDSCHGATFDLLLVASGGALTTPLFQRLTNVTYQSGGTFTIPAGFTAMANFAVNLSNVPDPVSNLSVTRASLIDSVAVAPQASPAVDPPAGAFATTVPFPQAFGTRSQLTVTLNRTDATGSQLFEVRTPNLAQPVALDLGKLQLPWLTSYAQSATGATWTTVAPGDAPDGMMTQWAGRWTNGEKTTTVVMRVVQPVEASGMTLPKLPASYAAVDPGQQTLTVTPLITATIMVDYDMVAGYDDFRRAGETLTASIGTLGAFVAMPFQRRIMTVLTRLGVASPAVERVPGLRP